MSIQHVGVESGSSPGGVSPQALKNSSASLHDAEVLAGVLMAEHGLTKKGWKFKFNNAVSDFGYSQRSSKTISLSRHLVVANPESTTKNILLHEIAHALVGHGHQHDGVWKAKALSIGCDGERCHDQE